MPNNQFIMTNDAIAENFSLLGKLMDIHGENSFKTKSYGIASFTIEKLPEELAAIPRDKIFGIRGIGDAIGKKIVEQLETGQLTILKEYISNTPPGILEMLSIKGIGPKKIFTIWKELGVETIGELLYACGENRLTLYKGFGEKTQLSIKESILFYLGSQGRYLYQQIENFAINVEAKLKNLFNNPQFYITGQFRRQMEVIDKLDWVTTTPKDTIVSFFTGHGYKLVDDATNYASVVGQENVTLGFYCVKPTAIQTQLFATSCSDEFLNEWEKRIGLDENVAYLSEKEIFSTNNISYIPP